MCKQKLSVLMLIITTLGITCNMQEISAYTNIKNCWQYQKRPEIKNAFFSGPIKNGPIIVFVHGTKESLISRLVHKVNYPLGIVPASLQGSCSIIGRVGYRLQCGDPVNFNINSIYLYGWKGVLTSSNRKKSAYDLYRILKKHKGSITLITHSHGSNLALYLAQIVKDYNDSEFKIDRLVLLAGPVQQVTAEYVKSPVFKQVYNIYSSADVYQIGDPQGIYLESRKLREQGRYVPFFSERTFKPAPNLTQARIVLDMQSPGHLHFLVGRFLRKLPATLNLLEAATKKAKSEGMPTDFIVNIPGCEGLPHLINKSQLRYIPRLQRKQCCFDYANIGRMRCFH